MSAILTPPPAGAVRVYDRHDPATDPTGTAWGVRRSRSMVWADCRELRVYDVHDQLHEALAACLEDRCGLLVWQTAIIGSPDVVRWTIRTLAMGTQHLYEGSTDRIVTLDGARLILLPTGYEPTRWKPARA